MGPLNTDGLNKTNYFTDTKQPNWKNIKIDTVLPVPVPNGGIMVPMQPVL